jgi:hypothetical protein
MRQIFIALILCVFSIAGYSGIQECYDLKNPVDTIRIIDIDTDRSPILWVFSSDPRFNLTYEMDGVEVEVFDKMKIYTWQSDEWNVTTTLHIKTNEIYTYPDHRDLYPLSFRSYFFFAAGGTVFIQSDNFVCKNIDVNY